MQLKAKDENVEHFFLFFFEFYNKNNTKLNYRVKSRNLTFSSNPFRRNNIIVRQHIIRLDVTQLSKDNLRQAGVWAFIHRPRQVYPFLNLYKRNGWSMPLCNT